MKYFAKYKTGKDLLRAVKNEPKNDKFFSRETMRFFGPQKFRIAELHLLGPCLIVEFAHRMPSKAVYKIHEDLSLRNVQFI